MEEFDLKYITDNIRQHRMGKFLTQDYMAYKLRMSQNAYSKLEQGKTPLKVETLLNIASILRVDVVELLTVKS